MSKNAAEYPRPDRFEPERWLTGAGNGEKEPIHARNIAFGFGRRCVGLYSEVSPLK